MITKKQAQRLVEQCFKNSFKKDRLISKKVISYVEKLKLLPKPEAAFAISFYLKLLKSKLAKNRVVVESAVRLSNAELSKIRKLLATDYKIVSLENKVTPSLLGGLRVKIGDMLYDVSLKYKVEKLGEAIHG